jgi:hypothetical protein
LIDIPLAFFAVWVGTTLLIRAFRLFTAHAADSTKTER